MRSCRCSRLLGIVVVVLVLGDVGLSIQQEKCIRVCMYLGANGEYDLTH